MTSMRTFPPFLYARFAKRQLHSISRIIVASVIFLGVGTGVTAAENDPDYIAVGAGAFDIFDDQTAAEIDVQLRLSSGLWFILPQVGFFATSDGALYGHAGIYSDFDLSSRIVLSPSVSVGAYHDGGGKDLGGVFAIRSAIELAYRFDNQSRLGVQFGHISNAYIHDSNPGEEFLLLNYSMPIAPIFAFAD